MSRMLAISLSLCLAAGPAPLHAASAVAASLRAAPIAEAAFNLAALGDLFRAPDMDYGRLADMLASLELLDPAVRSEMEPAIRREIRAVARELLSRESVPVGKLGVLIDLFGDALAQEERGALEAKVEKHAALVVGMEKTAAALAPPSIPLPAEEAVRFYENARGLRRSEAAAILAAGAMAGGKSVEERFSGRLPSTIAALLSVRAAVREKSEEDTLRLYRRLSQNVSPEAAAVLTVGAALGKKSMRAVIRLYRRAASAGWDGEEGALLATGAAMSGRSMGALLRLHERFAAGHAPRIAALLAAAAAISGAAVEEISELHGRLGDMRRTDTAAWLAFGAAALRPAQKSVVLFQEEPPREEERGAPSWTRLALFISAGGLANALVAVLPVGLRALAGLGAIGLYALTVEPRDPNFALVKPNRMLLMVSALGGFPMLVLAGGWQTALIVSVMAGPTYAAMEARLLVRSRDSAGSGAASARESVRLLREFVVRKS